MPQPRAHPAAAVHARRSAKAGAAKRLTFPFIRPNIPASVHAVPTRWAGLSLPHTSQDRRWGHGRGVRGRRPQARSPRRPEIPSRRTRQRRTSSWPFPAGRQGCILPESPDTSARSTRLTRPTGEPSSPWNCWRGRHSGTGSPASRWRSKRGLKLLPSGLMR